MKPEELKQRWRLVLGRFAENHMGSPSSRLDKDRDRALDFLYGREYQGRGVLGASKGGGLDPTQLSVPEWIDQIKKLFPQSSYEQMTKHALEKYELDEILQDPGALAQVKPDLKLLSIMMALKPRCSEAVLHELRRIIAVVVEQLTKELASYIHQALSGKLNRNRRSLLKLAANFDPKGTIRSNLKHWNAKTGQLLVQDLRFFARIKRQIPWNIILCVDQSGSMAGSLIYSAVMAGIFNSLPGIEVQLVVFDTSVVDLSSKLADPIEVLLSVQLGGGTDIGAALGYCQSIVRDARRTILILISDFDEGASPRDLLLRVRSLKESGVRLLGLAGLDPQGTPWYNQELAGKLMTCGMDIAVLSPKELTQWLKQMIS